LFGFELKLYMVLYKRVFCAKIEVCVIINITESMYINYRCDSNGFSLKTCEIHPVKDDFKLVWKNMYYPTSGISFSLGVGYTTFDNGFTFASYGFAPIGCHTDSMPKQYG
jgi:hypothetical protein